MKSSKGRIREKMPACGCEKKVHFECSAEPGSQVYVAGTFNKWDPKANPMKEGQGGGHYKAVVSISSGTHEYKFVVNGVWMSDPKCPDWTPDGCGALNSVIHV